MSIEDSVREIQPGMETGKKAETYVIFQYRNQLSGIEETQKHETVSRGLLKTKCGMT